MSKTVWIINQYASTPKYGYGGRHFYLGKELSNLGYKVYLITSATHHLLREQPEVSSTFLFDKITDGLSIVWCDLPRYHDAHSKNRVLGWFLFAYRIRKLIQLIPDRPDVVIGSSPSLVSMLGVRSIAQKFNARLVFEVRDIWPLTLVEVGGYSPRHPFIRFLQWIEDKAYRDADAVISNLKNAVEHMSSRGMDRSKFSWVPNGFSLDEVDQGEPLNDLAEGKLPAGKFIVGYTGTLGVANSLDTLIDAAEKLREYSEIHFVLVGEGKEKKVLQEYVKGKNLENITFLDAIPKVEIQAMLSQFDVCYLGLTKDPLFRFGVSPNKLFDYLYAGKPIIYGVDSGEYKPVTDNNAGYQILAEDSSQLVNAVLKLYRMPIEERKCMGENGRRAALQDYEYGKLAKKYADILFRCSSSDLI